jgi:ribosome-binding factor A
MAVTRRYSKTGIIRRSQKQSMLFREIAQLVQRASVDDPSLIEFSISRVELSDDQGCCYVYFFSELGKTNFKDFTEKLRLYKPSIRAALAKNVNARRVPQIAFRYDEQFAKTKEVEDLIESVKTVAEE